MLFKVRNKMHKEIETTVYSVRTTDFDRIEFLIFTGVYWRWQSSDLWYPTNES